MNITGIQLTLLTGKFIPTPVSPWVTEAIASVDVSHSENGPSTFQLTFNADRATALTVVDYPILLQQTVAIGNRVIVIVTVGGLPHILMDGLITHQELAHSRESGTSTISVTGEDISVAMDMNEVSLAYPTFGDEEMVGAICLKYEQYGIVPMIIPAPTDIVTIPIEWTPQQNETDRAFIQKLAAKHGYRTFVRPGLVPGTNTLYFGPPPRVRWPQSALTIDMGASTNVEQISFSYDGLAAELFLGETQDDETELDIPIATLAYTRLPPFATMPAPFAQLPFVRTSVYTDPRWDGAEAIAYAQSQTDLSIDRVVTADGTLDTTRYNGVLDTPGTVGVRGAGYSYDGIYYVNAVKHSIARGSYKQTFQLSREGLGSITPVVVP